MGFFKRLFNRPKQEDWTKRQKADPENYKDRRKRIAEELEKKQEFSDPIALTRKQYLQAVERKWDYKIGSLKAQYKIALENADQEKLDAEKEKLENAGIKQEDINYIIGIEDAKAQEEEDKKLGRVLKELPANA